MQFLIYDVNVSTYLFSYLFCRKMKIKVRLLVAENLKYCNKNGHSINQTLKAWWWPGLQPAPPPPPLLSPPLFLNFFVFCFCSAVVFWIALLERDNYTIISESVQTQNFLSDSCCNFIWVRKFHIVLAFIRFHTFNVVKGNSTTLFFNPLLHFL